MLLGRPGLNSEIGADCLEIARGRKKNDKKNTKLKQLETCLNQIIDKQKLILAANATRPSTLPAPLAQHSLDLLVSMCVAYVPLPDKGKLYRHLSHSRDT
jgi:hypothetical protein